MLIDIRNPDALLRDVGIDIAQSSLLERGWYSAEYGDIGLRDPVEHFVDIGLRQGRSPNHLFESAWYMKQNADVRAAGVCAFTHFCEYGWREGRDPGPWFSTSDYLSLNPDVQRAGVNPLQHYLEYGRSEGRRIRPDINPAPFKVFFLEDGDSELFGSWGARLGSMGFRVTRDIAAALDYASILNGDEGRGPISEPPRFGAVWFSRNAAYVTQELVRRLGHSLVVVFDDADGTRALPASLLSELTGVRWGATSESVARAMRLAGIGRRADGLTIGAYFNGRLLRPERLEPGIDVAWSPSASHFQSTRFARSGLRSCVAGCAEDFDQARIAVAPVPDELSGDVTIDLASALGANCLAVSNYGSLGTLVDLLGEDRPPVPLFKNAEELVQIVDHFLDHPEEGRALAERQRALAAGARSRSSYIGDFMRTI